MAIYMWTSTLTGTEETFEKKYFILFCGFIVGLVLVFFCFKA